MPDVDGQEKTEQATPKKLQDSREKGEVAKSTEINSFAIFSSGLILIYMLQGFLGSRFKSLAVMTFGSLDVLSVNADNLSILFNKLIIFFLITLSPVFITMIVIALAASLLQVGVKITPKAMKPKLSKFNILKGVKKLFFSSRSVVEVAKSLVKLIIIGTFSYFILDDYVNESMKLVDLGVNQIILFMINAAYGLVWKVALLFAVLAAFDYVYQKHKFKKDMMMTKQQVKEENKSMEGDPIVKGRIRKIQLEASRKRMLQSIPEAAVVITNPTHYAVALKYEMEKDSAPMVVAKGADLLAQKIKEVANEHNVPIHENKELAQALYKICDIGEIIPQELYQSVAAVLAYIQQIKNNLNTKNII